MIIFLVLSLTFFIFTVYMTKVTGLGIPECLMSALVVAISWPILTVLAIAYMIIHEIVDTLYQFRGE